MAPVGAARAGVYGGADAIPASEDLQHRWPTDEGSGSAVFDDVGSKDGSFVGAPTWTSGTGNGNFFLDYDATDDRVEYGNIWTSPTSLTLSVWADTWDASAFRTVIQQPVDGASIDGIHIGTDGNTGDMRFAFSGAERDTEPTPTGWAMATITWDGSTCKCYLDATEVHSFSASAPSWDENDVLSSGGRPNDSEFWDGGIDDPIIYASALTATEVGELYDATKGNY